MISSHLDHIWWWWVVRIYKGGKPILRCTDPNVLGTWSSPGWWKRSIFSSCDGCNGRAGNDFSLNCVLNDSHRRHRDDGHVYLLVGNYFSDVLRQASGSQLGHPGWEPLFAKLAASASPSLAWNFWHWAIIISPTATTKYTTCMACS